MAVTSNSIPVPDGHHTLQTIEEQLWAALHASLAYSRVDDEAMLRRDVEHFELSPETYEIDMPGFMAVIRSLRAMAEGGADA